MIRHPQSHMGLRHSGGRTKVRRLVPVLLMITGMLAALVVGVLGVTRAARPVAPRQDAREDMLPVAQVNTFSAPVDPNSTVYVVERDRTDDEDLIEQGRVLIVDTQSLQITGQIDTSYDPQVALAPDGNHFYVAETNIDGDPFHEQLRVIETTTGRSVNSVSIPHRFRSKLTVSPGVLAVSREGRYVHFQTYVGTNDQDTRYAIATYNGATGTLLPADIALPNFCASAMLWPLSREGTVAAVCLGHGHSVTLADVVTGNATTVAVPDPPGFINGIPKGGQTTSLVGSVLSPDGRSIYIVNKAGTVHRFAVATQAFLSSVSLDLPKDMEVSYPQVQLSRDGQRLYLGVGRTEATWRGVSEQVQVYDTGTWTLIRTVGAAEPVRSIALTPDEHLLMLHNASRTISRTVPDAPASATATTLDTPGSQLDALVTLP